MMPAGFTDKEKQQIEKRLIDEGEKLFSLHGLKKTTIKEITEAVGISQGSFYKFFDSKEDLYFKILDLEGHKIRKELYEDLDLIENKPKKGLKKLLINTYQILEENKLFEDLIYGDSYNILVRKLPEEKIEEHIETDFKEIEPLIIKWQEMGILKDINPKAVTGLLHALFYVTIHKKDIGKSVYNETFELLVELIVEGLVKERE